MTSAPATVTSPDVRSFEAEPAQAPAVWPLTAATMNGELYVGGVSMPALAQECGTPLYVVDEADFRHRVREWRDASGADRVHYAGKAFLCAEMVRWVTAEDLYLDVCSIGELQLALDSAFDPARLVLHGNNKSHDELSLAVSASVGIVVVDSMAEIALLSEIATDLGCVQQVYVRVAAGVAAKTHEYISTGGEDVKFGLRISEGAAESAALAAAAAPGLELVGIHSHIGSQLLTTEQLREAAARIGALVRTLRDEHRLSIDDVDLGGGAGIAYLPDQVRLDPAECVTSMREGLSRSIPPDSVRLSVEPGRSLIGSAGITLYTVGAVKDGLRRRFVAVDGGMSDALRPSLYGSGYTTCLANRGAGGEAVRTVVVGRHCESGDVVVPDLLMSSTVQPGDLLAVAATGAYHHTMANNYNMQPRPAVVSVHEGQARLMVRRELPSDLVARDGNGVRIPLPQQTPDDVLEDR